MSNPPRRLYKYRSFGVHALRLLSEAEVFYADPRSFNDPLDCDPTIQIDVEPAALEKLYLRMLGATRSEDNAKAELQNLRYFASGQGRRKRDAAAQQYYLRSIGVQIKALLDAEMATRGVLSFAERWDNPLMWSHYAEQHRGFCIEYDLTDHSCAHLQRVRYTGPRSVRTSELVQWKCQRSAAARQAVFDTYFFSKSPQWRHEREWRDLSLTHGTGPAPMRISAIYFGLRCDAAVRTSIVKLFANTTQSMDFFDIYPLEDTFRLKRRRVDAAQIEAAGVKNPELSDFRDILFSDDLDD